MLELYVISGATGNTASRVAHLLSEAGKRVRVISRKKNKLA